MLDDFLLFKRKHTRLVIIENSDTGAGVFSNQAQISGWVNKLNIEVLIGFPVVIVDNFDRYFTLSLSILERQNLVDSFVVLTSFSIAIYGANANFSWLLCLVQYLDLDRAASLTN